jgi:hydrogenase maturation protease
MNRNKEKTLIVGIGSSHGDDQLGWLVADVVSELVEQDEVSIRFAKSPVDLLDWLDDARKLIICDSCHGLAAIGDNCRWTWPSPEITSVALSGTHDLSLPVILQLAERLGILPNDVAIWAIEGAKNRAGDPVSARALKAVHEVANQIVKELFHRIPASANSCTNNH